jgi:hypothetical protein
MLVLLIFANISCTQSEYQRVGGHTQQNSIEQSSEKVSSFPEELEEKPTYKVVYRKSNLEALAIGRNRIEIQELMGEPEGKSLDGGNGYLWDYRRPVLDEVTGEIYGWSLVSFKFLKGLCAYVNISLANPPPEILEQKSSSNLFKF